ncbi:DUF317 domain-containing protein [Streptomyces sp. DSM 44915]|uniref:DUF317 domain-containing protein n=1 Tax=Streptomyces chisholmiae TaxID=3075540 RepID=A0ABU2JV01_9ACTN|nr:DUF317 domain-containing protein [Streptomyces sp. DSM 44915]MDT0268573.1 DUF317 domain-containing protein [Streptomyces sp. DSM 44915]
MIPHSHLRDAHHIHPAGDVAPSPSPSPSRVAGGDNRVEAVFAPLVHANWHHYEDELGNTYAIGGRGSLRVAYLAGTTRAWHLDARACSGAPWGGPWSAHFTSDTPTELVAAVTNALRHDACHDASAGTEHTDIWQTLRAARWHLAQPGRAQRALSPDGLVEIEYPADGALVPPRDAWRITTSRPQDLSNPLWTAAFHEATPTALLRAFTQALTTHRPVTRHS